MDFLGIGFGEIVLVLIVALLIFGPGKLVEVARSLGKMSRNIKRMSSDFTSAITKEVDIEKGSPEKTPLKPPDGKQVTPNVAAPKEDIKKPVDTTGDQPAERP